MPWMRRHKPKKAYIQNFSWFKCYVFKLYWLCAFHCSHRLLFLIHSCRRGFFVKIVLIPYWMISAEAFCRYCSHFILKWFQPNFFGEMWFSEESYKKMQKFKFWQFWECPLFKIKECTFKHRIISETTY